MKIHSLLPALSAVLCLILTPALFGAEKTRELSVDLSSGGSIPNRHGQSVFHSVHFELASSRNPLDRWVRGLESGATLTYSDIRQPRSWFGHRFGDPDDSVRGESACFFVRHRWGAAATPIRPYADLGTGPMWSNRRVPAATSRLNVSSQITLGLAFLPHSHLPLHAGYRFSHISNGGIVGRNPGLNVHSFFVGVRAATFQRH